ncbi:MAG: sigma-54-dependent transcriptional regulator, partial [Pseudomonadales bacterium]
MNQILVLDPEKPETRRIASLIESKGYLPLSVGDPEALREQAPGGSAIICNARWSSEVLIGGPIPVIIVDDDPSIQAAVHAIKAGAVDYLPRDASDEELGRALDNALADRAPDPVTGSFPMVGMSPPMRELFDSIAKVGPTDSTVLISGESGSGKELVARALHAGSGRRYAPMISLNCATVPGNLIEAELFGHSGEASRGLLETAIGGTLFLDEVGELPLAAQSRLLQALENSLDVRLITATHRDLAGLVVNGQFRKDLYYRLKVVSLAVPPLRDRGEDVLLLADAILARTTEKLAKPALEFAPQTQEDMRAYPWPGNIRELENSIHRAVILCDGGQINTELLAIEPPKIPDPELSSVSTPD